MSLPSCDGPKLGKSNLSTFSWQRLGVIEADPDSCTLEVRVNGKSYAIEVFQDFDSTVETDLINGIEKTDLTEEIIQDHAAPFSRECRAYGALIDAGMNGKYAAYCHGYCLIPVTIADELIRDTDKSKSWDIPADHDERFRPAIIKDLWTQTSQVSEEADWEAIEALHRVGIKRIGNVEPENLQNGKIRSFSRSETRPYFRDDLRGDHDKRLNNQLSDYLNYNYFHTED